MRYGHGVTRAGMFPLAPNCRDLALHERLVFSSDMNLQTQLSMCSNHWEQYSQIFTDLTGQLSTQFTSLMELLCGSTLVARAQRTSQEDYHTGEKRFAHSCLKDCRRKAFRNVSVHVVAAAVHLAFVLRPFGRKRFISRAPFLFTKLKPEPICVPWLICSMMLLCKRVECSFTHRHKLAGRCFKQWPQKQSRLWSYSRCIVS